MAKGERTVAFFEFVRRSDGRRVEHLEWTDVLARLAKLKPDKRTVSAAGRTLAGHIVTYDETDALQLTVTRDEDNPPQRRYVDTGVVEDAETVEGQHWVESSLILPAKFGNIIAIVRYGTASPHVSRFEDFVNEMPFFTDLELEARPVLSPDVAKRVGTGEGVDVLAVRANSRASGALQASRGLGRMLGVAREAYGDVDVELKITARKGTKQRPAAGQEERERLFGDAQVLYREADNASVTRAEARVERHDGEQLVRDPVDFLKDRITYKAKVDLDTSKPSDTREGGGKGSLRTVSGVRAMMRALEGCEDALRRATERSDKQS